MSERFTKIITYLFLIFLVWEQLGHHELKYHSDAQSLPAQEVSALQSIAIQLQLTENGVYISDEIDSSLYDKADQSTKSVYVKASLPSAKISGGTGGTNNPTKSVYAKGSKYGREDCFNGPGKRYICNTIPKSSVSSFTRNIKCSCNTDANNVSTCHVTGIDLSYNKLHDAIPDIWRNMSSLYILDLSHNKFTGEIPKSLGNIKPQIQNDRDKNGSEICVHFLMDLSYNQLEGPILATLGDLEK